MEFYAMKAVLCKQFGPPDSLVRGVALAQGRPGRGGRGGEGGERQLPRRAHHPEQVPVQAAAAVLAGSELAGVVKEVGAGRQGWQAGDKVIAFTTYGAFAEEVKTEAVAPGAVAPKEWIS